MDLDLEVDPSLCGKATLATYDTFPESVANVLIQIEAFLFGDRSRLTALAGLVRRREYGPTLNQWLRRMARPRYEIARELIGTYGRPDENGNGVDAFVVALVDMKYWLGSSATDSFADQVLLTREIARLSGGRLLPFVGYNPLRDVREDGASLALVKRAVCEHGFVGVKLYPANGFRPIGNAWLDDDFEGAHAGGDATRDLGREMDARLHEMYRWCSEAGVPVMAHENDTMGTFQRYSERGNPTYWGRVAERYPALRINIGHFGGMGSLTSRRRIVRELFDISYMSLPDAPENWALRILGLMTAHRQVYSDVGAFSGILKENGRYKRFERNLADLLSSRWYPAGTRQLMYGSDWYMVAATPGYREYYRQFEQMFRARLHPETASAILGENAIRFLGLRHGEPNRQRLEDFYRANGIEGAWRRRVDASTGSAEAADEPT